MSTRPPRISIGLPVFNGERYLDQTLQSILAQDYHDFELIVSDNASTDETVEIVERWAKKDSRIKFFRNSENLGGAANFNKVLELAEGDLFRWAGHDDLMAPGMLRRCIDTIDAVLVDAAVAIVIGVERWRTVAAYVAFRAARNVAHLHATHICRRVDELYGLSEGILHKNDEAAALKETAPTPLGREREPSTICRIFEFDAAGTDNVFLTRWRRRDDAAHKRAGNR